MLTEEENIRSCWAVLIAFHVMKNVSINKGAFQKERRWNTLFHFVFSFFFSLLTPD